MHIANPIYDVVFRYLMDDKDIARLIISKIIDTEVLDIQFSAQEKSVTLGERNLTVYRLDFTARIQTEEGEKQVLIEIQKAKFLTDIMRFRKYLASQYADEQHKTTVTVKGGKEKQKALPIISIYFLGHTLEHHDVPVLKIGRQYIDVATGEVLSKKEYFIESLTHDGYVVQIPYLTGRRRTDLECLLSVFDQAQQTQNRHILDLKESIYPNNYTFCTSSFAVCNCRARGSGHYGC